MPYDKQKVIDLALSQVGYHEKASNAELDSNTANPGDGNWTKYARDLDKLTDFYNGPKNGYAWCDIFVDWCFVTAYGRAAAQQLLCQPNNSAGAGCMFSAQYFRNKGQFYTSNPRPGDQIFFGSGPNNVWHTGIVVSVGNNHVYTVEGNTTDSVGRRSYALSDSSIYGYGRPNWGTEVSSSETPSASESENKQSASMPTPVSILYKVPLPLLKKGAVNPYVKSAQVLLIAQGCDCGKDGPDGVFGKDTDTAVQKFQKSHDLEVDGEIGGYTWTALHKF